MRRLRLSVSISALVFLGALCSEAAHPSRSRLTPCKMPGEGKAQLDAFCGTYQVWEDREAKAGRKLTLKVVVLPALSAEPLPDPVFFLSGGPGTAATEGARYWSSSSLRQERDFVFVDQRGTGEPDRLGCGSPADDLQSQLGDMFPLDAMRRCRDELAKKYDLTRYTVAAAVDDFDEVRGWLGYSKVNLVGGSYGTRTAQVYMRRHPEAVRTATLWGVVPMDEPVALSHASFGQRSLDLILGGCEKDPACHAKFPDVRKDFQTVMDRLAQGPMEVEAADPKTGKMTRVRLSRKVVADGIRLMLYSIKSGVALPALLHQAAGGDWVPLGRSVVASKADLDEMLARGQFFSVTCTQDIPFVNPEEVPARTAGSFLGDDRVSQHMAVCALWPRARIELAEREPIRSDLPVLLINGDFDPVTPPEFGRRAARFLTNSLHLVDLYASHEDSTDMCTDGIANEFVRRGTVQGLDTSCMNRLKPVPFLLEVPKKPVTPFGE